MCCVEFGEIALEAQNVTCGAQKMPCFEIVEWHTSTWLAFHSLDLIFFSEFKMGFSCPKNPMHAKNPMHLHCFFRSTFRWLNGWQNLMHTHWIFTHCGIIGAQTTISPNWTQHIFWMFPVSRHQSRFLHRISARKFKSWMQFSLWRNFRTFLERIIKKSTFDFLWRILGKLAWIEFWIFAISIAQKMCQVSTVFMWTQMASGGHCPFLPQEEWRPTAYQLAPWSRNKRDCAARCKPCPDSCHEITPEGMRWWRGEKEVSVHFFFSWQFTFCRVWRVVHLGKRPDDHSHLFYLPR